MEVFRASVALIIRALVVSARWAGRSRRRTLEQLTAAAETSRVAQLEARVASLEDTLELREAHIEVLESRLGQERPRKPYPLWLSNGDGTPSTALQACLRVSDILPYGTFGRRLRVPSLLVEGVFVQVILFMLSRVGTPATPPRMLV